MAYTDKTTGRNQRAAVMIAVALLEGAAIVALVKGLTVDWRKLPPLPNPMAENIEVTVPVPPLPPKPKEPVARPKETEITRPRSPLDVPGTGYNPPETPPLPPGPEKPFVSDPPPPPPPVLRAPRPLGRPGDWVTANDYPTSDLRQDHQGTTGFRLTIGVNGRVQSCSVTQSSGFPGLDEATCRHLTRRAQFAPATEDGRPVVGEYANNIRWVIPR